MDSTLRRNEPEKRLRAPGDGWQSVQIQADPVFGPYAGQVEGQINRLKTIKRQMYGRAGFDLLRARVLPYSPAVTVAQGPAP